MFRNGTLALLAALLAALACSSAAWAQCSGGNLPACPSPPFNAAHAATLAGDASTATVAGNGVTNPMATWMGYLSGAINPNHMSLVGTSAAALIADTAGFTSHMNGSGAVTAAYIYSCLISASCSATVAAADAVRGVAVQSAGSTVYTTTGVAGYVLNQQSGAGKPAGVAAMGLAICVVDGANCWGADTLISDHLGLNLSTQGQRGLYNEDDINVTSVTTIGSGRQLGGTWLAQPAIQGYVVNTPWGACGTGPCAPFAKWLNGFVTQDGATTTGIDIGARDFTPAPSVPSQPVYLRYYDAGGVRQQASMTALGGQIIIGGSTSSTDVALANGKFIANSVIVADAYAVATLPTCNGAAEGTIARVTDATAPTYNGALTGGGTVHVPVFCNGTAWTSH
jgi:hypothetical protein